MCFGLFLFFQEVFGRSPYLNTHPYQWYIYIYITLALRQAREKVFGVLSRRVRLRTFGGGRLVGAPSGEWSKSLIHDPSM